MNYASPGRRLFLISGGGHDLRPRASRNAEFYGWGCRIAQNFASQIANRRHVFMEIVHLDCEVVNARTVTGSLSHVRLAVVVFEKSEIDFSIAQTIPRAVLRPGFTH